MIMSMSSPSLDEFNRFTSLPNPLAASPFTQTTTTGILMMSSIINKPKNINSWSSGLCDCFSDFRNCWITCWCPCKTFGEIAEIVDKGSSSCGVNGALCALLCCVTCCPCCFTCFYRSKIRRQYALKEKPCCDCLVHCCCLHCALCQEHRELTNRGFDMNIGWHRKLEKESQGAATTPIIPMTPMGPLPPVAEESMSR